MIIPKECNFIHIIGFSLLCLTLWALPIVTMAKTNTDSFYGGQSLNSIVDGEKMTLTLPGGAKVAMENQENAYTLPDHTQSTRLAVEADNTVSEPIAYTPFGDNQATGETSLTESYTGMTFEPETATYDYHARWYDPSVARFTGLDSQREDASPYVYVGNNPIAFVDPNGLGRVSFYLYSIYGLDIPDSINRPGLMTHEQTLIEQTAERLRTKGTAVYTSRLENYDEIVTAYPYADELTHLTVAVHGNPYAVTLYDPYLKKIVEKSGSGFAEYLEDQLITKYKRPIDTLESIYLNSCETGLCVGSFGERFTDKAKDLFPNLSEVIASNYETMVTMVVHKRDMVYLNTIDKKKGALKFEMAAGKFFMGDFKQQEHLFIQPNADTVAMVGYPTVKSSEHEFTDYGPEKIEFFNQPPKFAERKPDFFTEPAFRRIQIERASGGSAVTPRIKTPSVDLPPRI